MEEEASFGPVVLPPRSGFTLRAHLEADATTRLQPCDGFDAEQIAAFIRGEWRFADLVVTASREDSVLGRAALPGVIVGDFPSIGGVSYVSVRVDPLRGVVSPLNRHERQLCDRAVALALLRI